MAFKNRLTAREVQTADKDVCDGSGLWLQVTPSFGGKSWLLRYRFDGRARQLGLGSALTTGLATGTLERLVAASRARVAPPSSGPLRFARFAAPSQESHNRGGRGSLDRRASARSARHG